MPALTRRREKDRHQVSWHVYYGDVQVGWIGERTGVPKDGEQWGWFCGFFPLSHRGVRADGTAAAFEEARVDFEAAWADILSLCTDADFAEHRFQRAFVKWKYQMWSEDHKMPTLAVSGMSRCFCSAIINNKTSGDHIRARHMEEAAN